MLELYHYATAVCPQKVRLVLAEKGLEWTSHIVNIRRGEHLAPDYRKLNPKAMVPTLVHDGAVIIESTVIMYYLDEAFPQPPLQPTDAVGRARVRLWTKRVDEEVHPDCSILSWATFIRQEMLRLGAEGLEEYYRKIPDPNNRERQRQCFEKGVEAPAFKSAIKGYDKMLADMEVALGSGAWLAGGNYSLADAAITPYVLRLDMLGMSEMWKDRKRVADWYQRIRARPSAETALFAFIKPADVDKMIGPGGEAWPAVRRFLAA